MLGSPVNSKFGTTRPRLGLKGCDAAGIHGLAANRGQETDARWWGIRAGSPNMQVTTEVQR